MAWFYNIIYLAILAVASPWLLVAALRKGKYRAGWGERFFGVVPLRDSQRKCVWLHAVSLGEVNLLQTVLEQIEREYPDWDVVISSTTATGYATAKKRYSPRQVFYAPLDFTWAVHSVLRRIRPDVLLLAELEVWPNLLRAAKSQGVKVAVINGRLSERSFRGYSRLQWLLRSTFAQIDAVAAQTEQYAERFRALGCPTDCVGVTGSLKFDGAQFDRGNAATRRLAHLAGIGGDNVVFLAGSTQAPEESIALDVFEKFAAEFPQLKLILVPRHPERFAEIAQLLDRRGVAWQRRSELGNDRAAQVASQPGSTRGIGTNVAPQPSAVSCDCPLAAALAPADASCQAQFASKLGHPGQPRVLLVDAVGELAAWWGLAKIAFVGGSLGNRGGQNMIEPAAGGAAVSFGPNTWNFRDVVSLLLASDAAVVVRDGRELARFVHRCLNEPAYADELGRRAVTLVRQQQGATELTMQLLQPLLMDEEVTTTRVDTRQDFSSTRHVRSVVVTAATIRQHRPRL